MPPLIDIAELSALMLLTGLAGGVLAGLLGVGGGIIIVPVLDIVLGLVGVDPAVRLHVAVATSLATIIPTAISSSRSHHRKGAVDLDLTRSWGPAVFIGAAIGTAIAGYAKGGVLAAIFGIIALVVAAKMLLPAGAFTLNRPLPKGPAAQTMPAAIGAFSSMMGIGGGTLTVPVLTLFNYPIHRAVGTASLFGLVIGIPGTIGYVLTGWGRADLPAGSLGYVNLIGLALIAPATMLAAPWGAKLAHSLSKRQLSVAFGCFLLMVGVRMLYRAVTVLI